MQTRSLVIGGVAAAMIAGGTGLALAQGDDSAEPGSPASMQAASPSPDFESQPITSIPNGGISAEDAVTIALREAGTPGATVTKVERDDNDGLDEWEVELREGTTEWTFEIVVATGEIRELGPRDG